MTGIRYADYIKSQHETIESIKFSLAYLEPRTVSLRETIISAVSWEYNYYLATSEKHYLYTGLLIIEAYLESGLRYDYGAECFDQLLSALGTTKEQVFPSIYYTARKIKLNKESIGRTFHNWRYRSRNGKTKSQIIDEIIDKVTKNEKGITTYQNSNGDKYILVINDIECYIQDQRRNLFYAISR